MAKFLKKLDRRSQLRDKHSAYQEHPLEIDASLEEGNTSLETLKEESEKLQSLEDPKWMELKSSRTSSIVNELVLVAKSHIEKLIHTGIIRSREEKINLIRKSAQKAVATIGKGLRITQKDLDLAVRELHQLYVGKGPLTELFEDQSVTDIYIDSFRSIRALRQGRLIDTPIAFRNQIEFDFFVSNIISNLGIIVDRDRPTAYGIVEDEWNTRVSVLHSSLSHSKNTSLVFHIPRIKNPSLFELLKFKMMPSSVASWLAEIVGAKEHNVLIVGQSGVGKTALLAALLSCVSQDERVCLIEELGEINELNLYLERIVRQSNSQHSNYFSSLKSIYSLVEKRSISRIVIDDLRLSESEEVLPMLELFGKGALISCKACGAEEALLRILANDKHGVSINSERLRRSLQIVVKLGLIFGRPCVTEVSEIATSETGSLILSPIIKFEREKDGKREWRVVSQTEEMIQRLVQKGSVLSPLNHINNATEK